MKTKTKTILESAGLKNPKDFALVEAVACEQRSPVAAILLAASLLLNVLLAAVLFYATQGLREAEAGLKEAAKQVTSAAVPLAKAAEVNQAAAAALLANTQSLPALSANLSESARTLETAAVALRAGLADLPKTK